jgi:transposase-like protein
VTDETNLTIGGKSAHPNPRRATVMNCPYCASENLWPDPETDNAWQCRDCCRVFSVKLHGQLPRGV